MNIFVLFRGRGYFNLYKIIPFPRFDENVVDYHENFNEEFENRYLLKNEYHILS